MWGQVGVGVGLTQTRRTEHSDANVETVDAPTLF